MSPELAALMRVAAALAASLVVHVAAHRMTQRHLLSLKLSLAAGLVCLILFEVYALIAAPPEIRFDTIALAAGNSGIFLASWFIFVNFVQATESSLRVRILVELLEAGREGLEKQNLLERYNDGALTRLRLSRLVAGGAIVSEDGRLRVAHAPLVTFYKAMRALKLLYLRRESEFAMKGSGTRANGGLER